MSRLTDFIRGFFGSGDFIDIRSAEYRNTMSELYYKELAIKQAVSIIAGVISKCEIKVYYDGDPADKSEEYYAWNVSPNDNQNAAEFKAKIIEELLLTGNALVFENTNGRFCADSFGIEKDGTKPYKFTNISVDNGSVQKSFKRKDVLYFKLGNCEITRLIDNVYQSYGDVVTAAITNYKNRSGSKWKLKISATAKAKPDFKQTYADITQKSLKTFFEAANAVYPEFDGFELINITPQGTATTTAAEITELRKDVFNMISAAFKIPISLFTGGTVSDADKKQFQGQCIEPFADLISNELTKQMFTCEQWKNGCRYEVDITNIESLDISELAGAAEKLIGSGVMNIDEVRVRILGLNALNTEQSTKYWITKNFADIKETNTEINAEGGGEE